MKLGIISRWWYFCLVYLCYKDFPICGCLYTITSINKYDCNVIDTMSYRHFLIYILVDFAAESTPMCSKGYNICNSPVITTTQMWIDIKVSAVDSQSTGLDFGEINAVASSAFLMAFSESLLQILQMCYIFASYGIGPSLRGFMEIIMLCNV